ncbi:MAG: hypothetical protein ACXIVE_01065, partial [Salinarimonas sp.]
MQTSERFDRILLNGSLRTIPDNVTRLLAPGGRLVGASSGEGSAPHLIMIEADAQGRLTKTQGARLRISPLVPPAP